MITHLKQRNIRNWRSKAGKKKLWNKFKDLRDCAFADIVFICCLVLVVKLSKPILLEYWEFTDFCDTDIDE